MRRGKRGSGRLRDSSNSPSSLEPRLQPLELRLQRADALGLDEVDVELQVAALLVERDAAVGDDGVAVLDELRRRVRRAAAALRRTTARSCDVAVLQREVDVAGRRAG